MNKVFEKIKMILEFCFIFIKGIFLSIKIGIKVFNFLQKKNINHLGLYNILYKKKEPNFNVYKKDVPGKMLHNEISMMIIWLEPTEYDIIEQ